MQPQLATAIVTHHLRLFGMPEMTLTGATPKIHLLDSPDATITPLVQSWTADGSTVVALRPRPDFLATMGTAISGIHPAPRRLRYCADPAPPWAQLRTLHEIQILHHPKGQTVVADDSGDATWLWLPLGAAGVLLVGTDLAGDLVRYRQGDPAFTNLRPTENLWGIPGERPNYLFETQLAGEPPDARPADAWCMALVHALSERLRIRAIPILPHDAPGAIVVTGDDDQAYLEKYAEQLDLLGETPITYFLHPKTRHRPDTLKSMLGKSWIEVELHPDALDSPQCYHEIFSEQAAWFRNLTGRPPRLVRNHGFLNDGYWGHLPDWLHHGIRGSANIPGFDGRILNGSLLPAQVAYSGKLTTHWSILTAIGDGIRFAGGLSDKQSADRIFTFADRIRSSGIPGVLVLNLHPQNVTETTGMHLAIKEIINNGFHPWNLGQCLDWFSSRTS